MELNTPANVNLHHRFFEKEVQALIKKILTILLCISLFCPTPGRASEGEELIFQPAEHNDVVQFLMSFGIIKNDDPITDTDEGTITRAEFLALALSAYGIDRGNLSRTQPNPFLDVPGEHPYIKEIIYAESGNLLDKNIGKFFAPDDELTAEFAAQTAVIMTERSIMLSDNRTYMSLAQSAHMFDGVQQYGNGKITRGGALTFIKNMLEAPVVLYDAISANGDKEGVRTDKDTTLLIKNFKYEKHRGILTSDTMTTVFGEQPSEGYVTIDGERYLLLNDCGIGMAGNMVEYYLTEYNDQYAIKYMTEYENDILTLDASAITGFDPVNLKYRAYVGTKEKNISIKRGAYISYNHEPFYDADYMIPEKGSVTFIDHDGDGTYDVVKIEEFTNTIVDYYSSYTETIYDADTRYDEANNRLDDISLKNADNIYITDSKRISVEPGSLEKNSVLSVYKSASGDKVRIIASTGTITGVLSSIDVQGRSFRIDDDEYRFSSDVRININELDPGKEYTFYADARGEIAYASSEDGIMAYLLNARITSPLTGDVQVQLLDEVSGKLSVYKLAEKVSYRTDSIDKSFSGEELYENHFFSQNAENQLEFNRTMALIRFNSNDEISEIVTAMEIDTYDKIFTAPDYPLYNLTYLLKDRPQYSGGNASPELNTSLEYKDSGNFFSRWLVIAGGAKVFNVPNVGEEIADEDAVMVGGTEAFVNGSTVSYDGYYTKNLNEIAVRYILKHGKASKAAKISNSWPYVVTEIVQCYTEKLGATYRLVLEGSSGKKTLYTKDETVILKENFAPENFVDPENPSDSLVSASKAKVEVGDIVYYSTDASGNMDSILMWWDSRENIKDTSDERYGGCPLAPLSTEAWMDTDSKWKKTGPAGGLIERKNNGIVELSLDETDVLTNDNVIQRIGWGAGGMKTFVIDFSGRATEIQRDVSIDELVPGDRIVLTSRGAGQCYVAVVYRR